MKKLLRRYILLVSEGIHKIRLRATSIIITAANGVLHSVGTFLNSSQRIIANATAQLQSGSPKRFSGSEEIDVLISSILNSTGINDLESSAETDVDITVVLHAETDKITSSVDSNFGIGATMHAEPPSIHFSGETDYTFYTLGELITRNAKNVTASSSFNTGSSGTITQNANNKTGSSSFTTSISGTMQSFNMRFGSGSATLYFVTESDLNIADITVISGAANITNQVSGLLHTADIEIIVGSSDFRLVSNGTMRKSSSRSTAQSNSSTNTIGTLVRRTSKRVLTSTQIAINTLSALTSKTGTALMCTCSSIINSTAVLSSKTGRVFRGDTNITTIFNGSLTTNTKTPSAGNDTKFNLTSQLHTQTNHISTNNTGVVFGSVSQLSIYDNWEYPVVEGTNITITQVYLATQNGNNLIIE